MNDDLLTLEFSDEEYKTAAKEYRRELLQLPFRAIADTLKYMTGMGNCRYKTAVGTIAANVGFGPYSPTRKTESTVDVTYRDLETFLGSVILDFEPNSVVQTLLGKQADFLGEGQKQAPSAKLVLATVMKSLGQKLGEVLFTARRNAAGSDTKDLFDGWMTIIEAAITAGDISAAKGNLFVLPEAISAVNAVDMFKAAERDCDSDLRFSDKFLYCAPEYADMYNDAYLASHTGLVYNTQYNQVFVEGSANKTTIVPLPCMAGLSKAIITPKANMLYGFDNMSQLEKIQVDRFYPFILTLSAAMFFGCQLYTLDKKVLKVVDLAGVGAGSVPSQIQQN